MPQLRLGVNLDHIATLRQQRHTPYPDLGAAIRRAEAGGADGITLHLREDRRHIQPADVALARRTARGTLNLEMAATPEMIGTALRVRPDYCCLVPEKRAELTTEGGLDLAAGAARLRDACGRLGGAGIRVSLFIEPAADAVDAAAELGAGLVELHTGPYANADTPAARDAERERLAAAAARGRARGLTVNAGHGLHADNVGPVASIPGLHELNIGHAVVCRAVFVGLEAAVRELRAAMDRACA